MYEYVYIKCMYSRDILYIYIHLVTLRLNLSFADFVCQRYVYMNIYIHMRKNTYMVCIYLQIVLNGRRY